MGMLAHDCGAWPGEDVFVTNLLPKEVLEGLALAQKRRDKRRSRLRVHVGDQTFPVRRLWENGIAVDREIGLNLRGLVDIYDGSRHLMQALIVTSQDEGNMRYYDFKWATQASDRPALDYDRPDDAPVGLLTHGLL